MPKGCFQGEGMENVQLRDCFKWFLEDQIFVYGFHKSDSIILTFKLTKFNFQGHLMRKPRKKTQLLPKFRQETLF